MTAALWAGYMIRVNPAGRVTLRRPGGRAVGFCSAGDKADQVVEEWLRTFPGSAVDDRRPRRRTAAALPRFGRAAAGSGISIRGTIA